MRVASAVVAAICSMWFLSQPAYAEKRVALVIGNSVYQNVVTLPNPANDAAAMAAMLKNAGFDVVTFKRDLKANDMRRALRDFSDQVRDADIAIVYFAGHGVELQGTNYLIPADAILERDVDAYDEAIPLDRVLTAVESAKQLRLIILDACRDNPFAKTMKHTLASRSIGRGLSRVEPDNPNTLIAFAAKAGSTAADGDDKNSPFTTALVKYLPRPGLDLRKAFGFVRDDVLKTTGNRQEPFVYGSLGGNDVALVPAAPLPQTAPPLDSNATARRDYELALQVDTPSIWESFIGKYPSGFYADLAIAQRNKIVAAQAAAAEEARLIAAKKSAENARAAAAEQARIAAQAKAAQDARIAADNAEIAAKLKAAQDREAFEAQKAREQKAAEKVAEIARIKAAEKTATQAAAQAAEKVKSDASRVAALAPQAGGNDERKATRVEAPAASGCAGSAMRSVTLAPRAATPLSSADECALAPMSMFRECENCPEMVLVPAGQVLMGSDRGDIDAGIAAANEGPQHKAIIGQPIAVGRFEVTRDQYAAFVKDTNYQSSNRCYTFEKNLPEERADRSFLNPGYEQDGNHPVVCVSWIDAKAYVDWLSRTTGKTYRLLSEAEFEYVAGAGSKARYGVSSDPAELCKFANIADQSAKAAGLPADAAYLNCKDGYPFTAPVGSFRPNAFGLYDVIGNVWEWTEDCFYGDYATAKLESAKLEIASRSVDSCATRTLRGGDWFSGESFLRPAVRAKASSDAHHDDIGFRVVRTIAP